MPETLWILVPTILIVLAGMALVWQPIRAAMNRSRLADARRDFHWQRERLEVKFIQLAWTNAKPSGPRWSECEFEDDVSYVRNRNTGELSAFVEVTVTVTETEDQLDFGPGAVPSVRAATAIFRFDGRHWETDGRAILNLSPSEAIRFYQDDLEIVGEELIGER
jgi:hypothetical protein